MLFDMVSRFTSTISTSDEKFLKCSETVLKSANLCIKYEAVENDIEATAAEISFLSASEKISAAFL